MLLATFILSNLTGCSQNNNLIVEEEIIEIESKYKEDIEVYRIKYLSDGLKVAGFIIKPKDIQEKLPVIIFNRGGNREFGKLDVGRLRYLSYLASRGYVVLASQYRGNDGGEGKEEFGGKDVNDVLNLITMAEDLAYADSNNIFMLGFSRGGMMTYEACRVSNKIKAAAVMSGVSDMIQAYEEKGPDMKRIYEELIGGNPETKEIEYKKRSAYYWADEINTPILILHGDGDERVRVSQAKKIAEKLDEYKKTYKLIVYPEAGHNLGLYHDEALETTFDWFKEYSQ